MLLPTPSVPLFVQAHGSGVALVTALFLMLAFAGCQDVSAPTPKPWEVPSTTAIIAPGDWVAHSYEADDRHVLSVTTNVSSGPWITLLALHDAQYTKFENGTKYDFIAPCSHDWMGNSTIACVLEAGNYVVVLLNDDRPGRSPAVANREDAKLTYSTTGAWIVD